MFPASQKDKLLAASSKKGWFCTQLVPVFAWRSNSGWITAKWIMKWKVVWAVHIHIYLHVLLSTVPNSGKSGVCQFWLSPALAYRLFCNQRQAKSNVYTKRIFSVCLKGASRGINLNGPNMQAAVTNQSCCCSGWGNPFLHSRPDEQFLCAAQARAGLQSHEARPFESSPFSCAWNQSPIVRSRLQHESVQCCLALPIVCRNVWTDTTTVPKNTRAPPGGEIKGNQQLAPLNLPQLQQPEAIFSGHRSECFDHPSPSKSFLDGGQKLSVTR